jgi:hypothetical protein
MHQVFHVDAGVARWFVFKPKIPIRLETVDIFLWPVGIFYAHLGYFMTVWYILCSFGSFFPVSAPKKSGNPG